MLKHGQPSTGRVIDDGTDTLANGRQQARIFSQCRSAVCIVGLELLKARIARCLRLFGCPICDTLRVAGVSIDSGGDRATGVLGTLDNGIDDATGLGLLRLQAKLLRKTGTASGSCRLIGPQSELISQLAHRPSKQPHRAAPFRERYVTGLLEQDEKNPPVVGDCQNGPEYYTVEV